MEELKTNKKANRKAAFLALIITIVIVLIISILFFIENINSEKYENYNFYTASGDVLNVSEVYPNILLQIENRVDGIFGVVLNNREYVSQILLCGEKFENINDYSVRLVDYNNDGNKEFAYVSTRGEKGYNYKLYSIDKTGNILYSGLEVIGVNIDKASVKMTKVGEKYEYIAPVFYYDGYKVTAEIGEYKLDEKVAGVKSTVSKNSKISVDGKYNAIPRSILKLDEFPKYLENVNAYMKNIEDKECIEVDLDGDDKKEYLVCLVKDKNIDISLFDSSSNFLVNLLSGKKEANLEDYLEIADVDNDGIMEIIIINQGSIKVHRYNNGFFY